MSERVRQSVISSLYGSKRIIVAACAAIAMVLGAMSVGASVFTGERNPGAHDDEISSISATTDAAHGNVSEEKNSDLTAQHALETRSVMSEQPTPHPAPQKSKKSTLSEILINSANAALFVNQVPLLEQLQTQLQAKAEADAAAAEEAATAAATPTEPASADEEPPATDPADTDEDITTDDTENRSTDTGSTLLNMTDSGENH